MKSSPVVYLVDDDEAIRDALGSFLQQSGFNVKTYGSGREFLQAYCPDTAGCVLLDLSMPEMDGFDVQEQLAKYPQKVPIVFLTAFGTVRDSVSAIKAGAFDFLEKPCSGEILIECIREAMGQVEFARAEAQRSSSAKAHYDSLSPREREIMAWIARGKSSKQIGRLLDISPRTVDAHRARVMIKMEASSLAELGAMAAQFMELSRPGE